MTATKLLFQYCQKLVLFDKEDRILLARRKDEADYDGIYSFIGGKMETTDTNLAEGVRREKTEEIGSKAIVFAAPHITYNVFFTKKDGSHMILPHIYGYYDGGKINLNEEYSDYIWVPEADIDAFEPKIETIPDAVRWAQKLRQILDQNDLIRL